MKQRPTVSLQLIVKDEKNAVNQIVTDAINHVDEINITVSDKSTADFLISVAYPIDKVNVVYRQWTDDFAAARNANFAMSTTDFTFWIDADDYFDFSELQDLVEFAESNGLDQLMLPYEYAHDEAGKVIALHWRERLLRRSHPFVWKGRVHETCITDVAFKSHKADVPVVHQPAEDHVQSSLKRNHEILVKAAAETDDPRYKMYLGSSFHAIKEYRQAINILDEFTNVSENIEDIYRALNIMSECAHWLGDGANAISFALQAAGAIPDYPQAYWLLGQWEFERDAHAEALEWLSVSETKPDPTGFGVYNPQMRESARLIAAQCESLRGNFTSALKWLRLVSPDNQYRQDLEGYLVNEADAETFIQLLPNLVKYFESDKKLYEALCNDLKYDARLRGLREQVEPPTAWGMKSLVILCGEGYEEWGPHTLDKGMGGSEEAVVYLSRELSNLGWDVTVYGPVTEEIQDDSVTYRPWKQFNRMDSFNVFVAWRSPDFTEHVNARVKIVDLHDIVPANRIKNYGDVTYFVKSKWQRELYPAIPDSKFRVIGNGIKKEQFYDS